ncbi:hypothetical protein ONZ51_g6538 [Trametes cubensis]|uniref:Uncharacterized protein n=1 Tax=Trametes cubensis TaxID=1111947 RepID=A0AAD7XAH3_9APHY|nr:hypothetical protein ONZ51_g6538 [Trametes cubensis]
MEDTLTGWQKQSCMAGWLYDFFDGAISCLLLGVDGLPFFRHELDKDSDGELHIALALGVDWFSYLQSLIAPLYMLSPMLLNIINLPPSQRYCACNLLSVIIPSPKKTNPDQTQHYLKILVNELLRLWCDGVVLRTQHFPQGHHVPVILTGVFCDKPAAHKVGGFGSHVHMFFCTHDWITQGFKVTLPELWEGLNANNMDVNFIAKRLEKANPEDETDGTAPPRQSSRVRIPTEKAREMVLEVDDAGAMLEDGDEGWEDDKDDNADPSMRTCQLHPRNLDNFLKLCRSLCLFTLDVMSEEQIASADKLMREYCIELMELYGLEVIRPNHHYAIHTSDFICDYGPL